MVLSRKKKELEMRVKLEMVFSAKRKELPEDIQMPEFMLFKNFEFSIDKKFAKLLALIKYCKKLESSKIFVIFKIVCA